MKPTDREKAAAEYGYAALKLEEARRIRANAEGNASSALWAALNADVMAAEAWVNVRFATLLALS